MQTSKRICWALLILGLFFLRLSSIPKATKAESELVSIRLSALVICSSMTLFPVHETSSNKTLNIYNLTFIIYFLLFPFTKLIKKNEIKETIRYFKRTIRQLLQKIDKWRTRIAHTVNIGYKKSLATLLLQGIHHLSTLMVIHYINFKTKT